MTNRKKRESYNEAMHGNVQDYLLKETSAIMARVDLKEKIEEPFNRAYLEVSHYPMISVGLAMKHLQARQSKFWDYELKEEKETSKWFIIITRVQQKFDF